MPNGHAPNFTSATTVDNDSGISVVLEVVNEDDEMLPAVGRVQKNFDLPATGEQCQEFYNAASIR